MSRTTYYIGWFILLMLTLLEMWWFDYRTPVIGVCALMGWLFAYIASQR